jgi:hypothetical protein
VTPAEAVRLRLLAISAVTALISTRVYVLKFPENLSQSAIRVTEISEQEPMHARGSSGLARARIQVDSVGFESSGVDAYSAATALDAAAKGAGDGTGLLGWSWSIGSPALEVEAILPADVRDLYEASELRRVTRSRDYIVWFRTA